MKERDKRALAKWQAYCEDIQNEVPVDVGLSVAEKQAKLAYLEAHPVEWIQFFLPNFAKYEFAPFHLDFIDRILSNDEWFEVLSWSRELAKSTLTMMVVMYLTLTRRKKNVILASATEDSAIKLLRPYMREFECNGRIKAFYGEQVVLGQWKEKDFKCQCGASFMGVGAGSAPRGARNGSIRPDVLLVDDFDTDEDCRNANTLQQKWDWWEKALYPTRSVSEPTLVIFCGNIIAQDCCVKRAGEICDHWDIVNIRDAEGHSTWPSKNTEEKIDRILAKISTKAAQGEYFNNPIAEGKVFKNCYWGKIPPLHEFKYLMNYGDPSYSDKKASKSSMKALVLLGLLNNTLYVIKAYVEHCTNAEYIGQYFAMKNYVNGATTLYHYMENNKLQDPFYTQVFMPLLRTQCSERGEMLSIRGDERKKTDKATRIEANLEPMDREGRIIFNEEEQNNPWMKELRNQFMLFDEQMKYCADGPDAVEGGYSLMADKQRKLEPCATISVKQMAMMRQRI